MMSNENLHLFYTGPFSQWWKCSFEIAGVTFNCAEQYMMYQKALVFGDLSSATSILAAKSPRDQKRLGRSVTGFNEDIWAALREGIVFSGNYAKFQQNKHLREMLLSTGEKLLAEASPTDVVWGIGRDERDPKAFDMKEWRGLNLLGIALTRVREVLRWEERVLSLV